MKSRVSRAVVAVAALISLLAAASPAHAEWNKGLEAYKNKDWATAVKEFEEVTKTNPDYAGAYYMLGVSQRSTVGDPAVLLGWHGYVCTRIRRPVPTLEHGNQGRAGLQEPGQGWCAGTRKAGHQPYRITSVGRVFYPPLF